jgi:hypothetical protein
MSNRKIAGNKFASCSRRLCCDVDVHHYAKGATKSGRRSIEVDHSGSVVAFLVKLSPQV